jgi:hypothetical protein
MCAYKETDVRKSLNDSTLAAGEGHGSHGETFHPHYRENPVSSLPECGVFILMYHCHKLLDLFTEVDANLSIRGVGNNSDGRPIEVDTKSSVRDIFQHVLRLILIH